MLTRRERELESEERGWEEYKRGLGNLTIYGHVRAKFRKLLNKEICHVTMYSRDQMLGITQTHSSPQVNQFVSAAECDCLCMYNHVFSTLASSSKSAINNNTHNI